MSDGPTRWARDAPGDAEAYDAQWARLTASGVDPHGEATFVMTYGPASVLDAGCGTGRVAIELAHRGVQVVGVDLDDALLTAARAKAPELEWHRADLTTVDLGRGFDVVVLAGNVMIFLVPGTEGAALENLRRHLAPGGRLVAGFQVHAERLPLATFDALALERGLVLAERYGTWDRTPYEGGDYAVSVLEAR
jgi:SAM-dependent methyltransferase